MEGGQLAQVVQSSEPHRLVHEHGHRDADQGLVHKNRGDDLQETGPIYGFVRAGLHLVPADAGRFAR